MPAPSDPSPEMLNDPDGRQLVAAIHARRAGKTTAAKEAHLTLIANRAELVRNWLNTDLDNPRNMNTLIRNVQAQAGDVTYLIAELRERDEAIARALEACDRIIDNTDGHKPPGPPHPSREQATAVRIRAALKPNPTTTGEPA